MLSYFRRAPDLVAKLQASASGCIAFEAGGECAIAITGPGVEPIEFLKHSPDVFHDLYYKRMPTAPVLYLVAHVLDDRLKERRCIAVFDVNQPEERHLVSLLTKQTELRVFFVTPSLGPLEQHILDWDGRQREHTRMLLAKALQDLTAFTLERYDFQSAVLELWRCTD